MKKLTIKQIPKADRPYEKFEKYGATYLTDAELLAVIIKNGSKTLNCLDTSKYILLDTGNLELYEAALIRELLLYSTFKEQNLEVARQILNKA